MSDPETVVENHSPSPPVAERSYVRRGWPYYVLWLLAILSFIFNLLLVAGLLNFRQRAQREVANASALLQGIEIENFDIPIHVNETIPISMTVPFSDTFVVPIRTTVPVSTEILFTNFLTVPINEEVAFATSVSIPGPLGSVLPPVPVASTVPVSLTIGVPLTFSIPVSLTLPVDLVVEIPVQSTVAINQAVPVVMDFPVTVPFDQMGFQSILAQVQDALDVLADLLGTDLPPPAVGAP